jgi:hypothetical protein
MQYPTETTRRRGTSFDIEDPVANPLVLIPDDADVNWGTEPLPPPRASFKRNPDDIPDEEAGVTSDWNFVLPTY